MSMALVGVCLTGRVPLPCPSQRASAAIEGCRRD